MKECYELTATIKGKKRPLFCARGLLVETILDFIHGLGEAEGEKNRYVQHLVPISHPTEVHGDHLDLPPIKSRPHHYSAEEFVRAAALFVHTSVWSPPSS